MRARHFRWPHIVATVLVATFEVSSPTAWAQELAPRAYWPSPNGTNAAEGDLGDLRGIRAIVGALFGGNLEIVHALLDAGADVRGDESNPFQTPLTTAIARGDLAVVNRMLELGARVHSGDLGQAADGASPEIMERLMQVGISVDDLYLGTMPVVFAAARRKKLENIDFLLGRGADVDAMKENEHSALTYVLDERDADTAAFLLSRGADPNMTNGEGRAPLHYAAGTGMVETVELLLEHGADPDNVDDEGMSVLQLAVMVGDAEIVRTLIARGADAGKRDPDGATPLMYAATLGNGAICELLLEGGAPVNVTAKTGLLAGKTAMSLARLAGYDDIVELLKAAGAGDPIYLACNSQRQAAACRSNFSRRTKDRKRGRRKRSDEAGRASFNVVAGSDAPLPILRPRLPAPRRVCA